MPLDPERFARFDTLSLDHGGHRTFDDGHCALEVAAYIAGEPHSASPRCVCPVITRFLVAWNDRLASNDARDRLIKPLLPKILDTRSTREVERKRGLIAIDWAYRECAPTWLELAGLASRAVELRALPELTTYEAVMAARPLMRTAREEASAARAQARAALAEKFGSKAAAAAAAAAYAAAAYAADAYAADADAYAAYAADADAAYAARRAHLAALADVVREAIPLDNVLDALTQRAQVAA